MFGWPRSKKPRYTSVEVGVLHITLDGERLPVEVGLALYSDYEALCKILCDEETNRGEPYSVRFYSRPDNSHRLKPLLKYRETMAISPKRIRTITICGLFAARLCDTAS